MYILLKLLCLLSMWPFVVLGSFQVLVQTSSTPFLPGDIITYTLVADPIPNGTLGMVLIPVQEGNAENPRPYTPFSATMDFSPQQFTVQIPTSLTLHSFYEIDGHADSSVYSTFLGNSNPFEIEITPPSSTTPIVTTTENVTKTTVINTTSQSLSAGNLTTAPATTSQSPPSDSNLSSSPTSSAFVSVKSQGPSEELPTITSTSAAERSLTPSSSSPDASADGSAVSLAQKSRSIPVGAIVGGVVGGILVIILLLVFLLYLRRRRQHHQRDVVFHMPTDTTNSSTIMIHQTRSAPLTAGSSQRPFLPNRSPLAISPFVVINNDQRGESASPEFSSAKSREAFGSFGAGLGHIPALPYTSLSGDSIVSRGASQDILRSERERILSEISALRTGTGATVANTVSIPTADTMQPGWPDSSGFAVGSEEDNDNASEMREKLEQLTNHVRRLESALVQVSHGYDAPPVYDGSQR